MSSQKKQIGQKTVLGFLLFCIIGLTVFSYLNYMETEEKITFLENAKGMIMEDLKEIESDLDELAKENDSYATEIQQSRYRIAMLLDSISRMEVDYQILGRYRRELASIRLEKRELNRKLDSVQLQNTLLSREIDSANLRYIELERYSNALKMANEDLTQFTDSLINENIELTARVKGQNELSISALEGTAYRVRGNGKVVKTSRVGSAQRLRACFNLAPNTLLHPGEKVFYLQFLAPDNEVLGAPVTANANGNSFAYSKKLVVDFENRPMNICDYIIVDGLQLEGNYRVNLFYREKLLSTAVFTLK